MLTLFALLTFALWNGFMEFGCRQLRFYCDVRLDKTTLVSLRDVLGASPCCLILDWETGSDEMWPDHTDGKARLQRGTAFVECRIMTSLVCMVTLLVLYEVTALPETLR